MPKARKTIEVEWLKQHVNARLSGVFADKNDDQLWDEVAKGRRIALAHLLEDVLMETGNYKGFAYEYGENWHKDETRRRYF